MRHRPGIRIPILEGSTPCYRTGTTGAGRRRDQQPQQRRPPQWNPRTSRFFESEIGTRGKYVGGLVRGTERHPPAPDRHGDRHCAGRDRKSTRLNSSHLVISYAVFCLKKKKKFFSVYFSIKKQKTKTNTK